MGPAALPAHIPSRGWPSASQSPGRPPTFLSHRSPCLSRENHPDPPSVAVSWRHLAGPGARARHAQAAPGRGTSAAPSPAHGCPRRPTRQRWSSLRSPWRQGSYQYALPDHRHPKKPLTLHGPPAPAGSGSSLRRERGRGLGPVGAWSMVCGGGAGAAPWGVCGGGGAGAGLSRSSVAAGAA